MARAITDNVLRRSPGLFYTKDGTAMTGPEFVDYLGIDSKLWAQECIRNLPPFKWDKSFAEGILETWFGEAIANASKVTY